MQTGNQFTIKINISPEKKMKELFKFYLEKVNLPNSFGDSNIRFLVNGNCIQHEDNRFIKNFLNNINESKIIVVDDLNDQISPPPTV